MRGISWKSEEEQEAGFDLQGCLIRWQGISDIRVSIKKRGRGTGYTPRSISINSCPTYHRTCEYIMGWIQVVAPRFPAPPPKVIYVSNQLLPRPKKGLWLKDSGCKGAKKLWWLSATSFLVGCAVCPSERVSTPITETRDGYHLPFLTELSTPIVEVSTE